MYPSKRSEMYSRFLDPIVILKHITSAAGRSVVLVTHILFSLLVIQTISIYIIVLKGRARTIG